MKINANSFTPTNADLIPTGQIALVASTRLDPGQTFTSATIYKFSTHRSGLRAPLGTP